MTKRVRTRRALLLITMIPLLCGFVALERLAIPPAEPIDPFWSQHDRASERTVDHSAWNRFLQTYVESDPAGVNRVGYARVSSTDRNALEAYLALLSEVPVQNLTRSEQLAFWVNLYNARTVALILDHYPVESIRDISFGLLSFGPWSKPLLAVQGRELSLHDIEHGIIRPLWPDPRIHYVLNCAAVGCPNLRKAAYTGFGIDAAMEQAARAYVNDPRGVRVDEDGGLTVSKIYGWFKEDFGNSEDAVLAHLQRYAEPGLAARLANRNEIDDYVYDWSLNDAASAPARNQDGTG